MEYPQNAPTGPRQARHRPIERQPDVRQMRSQQSRQDQQASEPPEFNTRALAIRQSTRGALPGRDPAHPSSLVAFGMVGIQLFPHLDMEWQQWQDLDDAKLWDREEQRQLDAFMSQLDADQRERQRRDDAERQERQAREQRELETEKLRAREAREEREFEREKMRHEREMKMLEAREATSSRRRRGDDSRPRHRSRSRSVERRRHGVERHDSRGRATQHSPSRHHPRSRSPGISHRSSARSPSRSRSTRSAILVTSDAPGTTVHHPRGLGQSLRWTPQTGTVYPQMDIVNPRARPLSQARLQAETIEANLLAMRHIIAQKEQEKLAPALRIKKEDE